MIDFTEILNDIQILKQEVRSLIEEMIPNKTVLITGASRGLGKVIANNLHNNGYNVIGTYNTTKPDDTIPYDMRYLNINNDLSIQKFILSLHKIDILINNAGINRPGDFMMTSIEDVSKVIRTNLLSTYVFTQYILPFINKGGNIINISSSSAATGGPVSVHYAASKAGIEAVTRGLALYLASSNIKVNAIAPGYLDSEMITDSPIVRDKIKQIPLGRMGTFEEVADLVLYLCENTYINGQVIKIDGGLVL